MFTLGGKIRLCWFTIGGEIRGEIWLSVGPQVEVKFGSLLSTTGLVGYVAYKKGLGSPFHWCLDGVTITIIRLSVVSCRLFSLLFCLLPFRFRCLARCCLYPMPYVVFFFMFLRFVVGGVCDAG